MPKFAANLTMLFNELPFLERFAAATQAGFKAVEFQFPYDFETATIHDALKSNNLTLVLHNLPAGNWAGGERGIACAPARTSEFRESVTKAIAYAQALNCPQINCLAGIVQPENATVARATLVENLGFAAAALQKAGITLLLEPVNIQDIPGFFVNRSAQALGIINEVAAPNLKLQYDIYHSQIMEGNLARTIENNLAQIGHIQLADNPGRHEPGTGEINYHYLFKKLDELGYTGWVGCEYKPSSTTLDGLSWLAAHHIKL